MTAVDPRARLQHVVRNAIEGCAYAGSVREEERLLRIDGLRSDGTRVHLRLRGVRDSAATSEPEPGAVLRLLSVGGASGTSLLRFLLPPLLRGPSGGAARVRIGAGSARIDVVCEDAEWWEDPPPPKSAPAGGTGA